MDSILTCDDLLRATGYRHPGDLARSLTRQGIKFFYGKGGIVWTTVNLIDAAGGLRPPENEGTATKLEDLL
jgi:hypothetical protein